jgi:Asp/Glu/hydantoin racemase
MTRPRIVLLHATPVAMDPIRQAFAERWPDAETVNLLDDALTTDRARNTELTEALSDRFVSLCHYGASLSASGILVTCSAFGPAIEAAASKLPIPVVKPNAPMFDAAIGSGRRVAMIATFEPAVVTMEDEFRAQAESSGAQLTSFTVPEAMTALRKGDEKTHNRLIAEKAAELSGFDAIMLAHFSTSRAADEVRRRTETPVFTAPEAAVEEMRRRLGTR